MYNKTQALILKSQTVGKKNTYITAYTKDFGKITCLARGLNKNEAKLKSALLPFAYSEMILVVSRGRPVITRASLIEDLFPRQSLINQLLAFYFLEVADKSIEEELKDKRLLSLLVASLNFLNKQSLTKRNVYLLLTYFSLKLIKYLGYFPDLDYCNGCSKKIQSSGKLYLSYKLNGLLCSSCKNEDKKAILINQQERNFLRFIDRKNFHYIKHSRLSDRQLKKLCSFANLYLFYVLDVNLKSFSFLKKLFFPHQHALSR